MQFQPPPVSPPGGSRARPLPKPPGAAGSSSSNGPIPMPEANPYVPNKVSPQADNQHRPSSSASTTVRRLPVAPDASPYSPSTPSSESSILTSNTATGDGGRAYGLPSQPRMNPRPPPPPQIPSYTSGSSGSSRAHPYAAATPVSEASSPQLPSPGQWSQSSGANGSGANGFSNLARSDSARPRGALAPAVPGQPNGYGSYNNSVTSPTTSNPSIDYYSAPEVPITLVRPPDPPAQLYSRVDPALRPYSPSHVPASYVPRAAQDGGAAAGPSVPRVPSRNGTVDPYGRSSTDDNNLLSPNSSIPSSGSAYNSAKLDVNQTPTCKFLYISNN